MELGGIFDWALFESVLRALTPVLLAALAGLLCTKVGVFNVGLEGLMLTGCFAAVAGSWFSGSAWIGVVVAVLAGMAMAGGMSFVTVTLGADAIIVGIALNLLAVGLTSFLVRTVLGAQGTFQDPDLEGLPLILSQSPLTYLSLALVPAFVFFLRRTVWGFRLQGVGEVPGAARSLGINTHLYQHMVLIASGALCGLAGAQLSLGNVVLFSDNMTAGRGWVAVVAVMLGQAAPIGTLLAALLFGVTDAVGVRLQGQGLPSQFTSAAPYAFTLIALIAVSVRARARTRSRVRGGPSSSASPPAPLPASPVTPTAQGDTTHV
jgi:simple sugar transport system permease protein